MSAPHKGAIRASASQEINLVWPCLQILVVLKSFQFVLESAVILPVNMFGKRQ